MKSMRMIISVRLSNGTIMNVVGNFQNKDSALAMARQYSQDLFSNKELHITNKDEIVEIEKWAQDKQIKAQAGGRKYTVGYVINGNPGLEQINGSGVKSVYNSIKLRYGLNYEFFALIYEENQVISAKYKKKSAIAASKSKLRNKKEVDDIILKASNKMKTFPVLGEYAQDIALLLGIIRDYINGSYREIPVGTIVGALACVIYFVSPIDVVPDFLPVVGQLDDVGVIIWAVKLLHDDIQDYRKWLDEDEGVEI